MLNFKNHKKNNKTHLSRRVRDSVPCPRETWSNKTDWALIHLGLTLHVPAMSTEQNASLCGQVNDGMDKYS